jgi:hypothetical protein
MRGSLGLREDALAQPELCVGLLEADRHGIVYHCLHAEAFTGARPFPSAMTTSGPMSEYGRKTQCARSFSLSISCWRGNGKCGLTSELHAVLFVVDKICSPFSGNRGSHPLTLELVGFTLISTAPFGQAFLMLVQLAAEARYREHGAD